MVRYVQCLVCGRITPADKGVCYHCKSPLPTSIDLPEGLVICPNCLRITPVDTGYCYHCKSPLPPSLIDAARKQVERYKVLHGQISRGNTLAIEPLSEPYYARIELGMPASWREEAGQAVQSSSSPVAGSPRVSEIGLTESISRSSRPRVLIPRGVRGGGRM